MAACAFALHTLSAVVQAQSAGQVGEPLVLTVDPGQPAMDSIPGKLVLHEGFAKLREQFKAQVPDVDGPIPLHWADFQPAAPLQSASGEQTLSIGPEGTGADVEYHFDRQPDIGDAQHGPRLWLTATNPSSLPTGVYTGQLTTQVRTPLVPGFTAPFAWPVVVAVKGQRVYGMSFTDDRRDAVGVLRFGDRGSVEFLIESVESGEMWGGQFELTMEPPNADPIVCRLPLPLDSSLDPAIRASRVATVPLQWAQDIFRTELLDVTAADHFAPAEPAAAGIRHTVQRMQVVLPPLFATGHVRARVLWDGEPADAGADDAGSRRRRSECSAERRIGAGVLVAPAMAFMGEPVLVRIAVPVSAVPESASKQLPLKVWPSNERQNEPLMLKLAADQPVGGQEVIYEGQNLIFPQLGDFHIQPADDRLAALAGKRTVHVVFEQDHRLGKPLLIFNETPPFWWGWVVRDEELARSGVRVVRDGAVHLMDRSGRNQNVVLRFRGFMLPDGNLLDEPGELNTAPEFSFVGSGDSAQQAEAFPIYKASDKPAPYPDSLRDWRLGQQGVLINLKSDISTLTEETRQTVAGPRAAYGTRTYHLRFSIEGYDPNGAVFQRIVLFPFTVEVRSHWYYDRWLAIACAILIVTLVMLSALKLRQDRQFARRHVRQADDHQLGLESRPSSAEELEPTSFMPTSSAASARDRTAPAEDVLPEESPPGSLLGGGSGSYSDEQDRFGGGLMPD